MKKCSRWNDKNAVIADSNKVASKGMYQETRIYPTDLQLDYRVRQVCKFRPVFRGIYLVCDGRRGWYSITTYHEFN